MLRARFQRRRTLALLGCLVAVGGCVQFGQAIMPSPLTFSEQEKEILTIAPTGTRREDVLQRLRAAGIEGSFASSQRIYYCDVWDRKNGERWHLNLALLFDESGRLYRVRTGDSEISAVRDEGGAPNHPDPSPANDSRKIAEAPAQPAAR